ncbi:hypothetical protein C8C83_1885 [Flavobacterium sp. 90]|uniref:hypothetical protein n=1 Tax=unclassified Flavobacterium TaxID=196869 RepID=UPI000F0D2983|nr:MULTISPECIES: hypothetical protein [unclassified Flavobacterium]RKR10212.1 hypothetical protein C8C82_2187 [Flavobacterium sp. 81]TCK53998.1 hypothetical protein C8C83_1885 [Flavobacterium sp. 90]
MINNGKINKEVLFSMAFNPFRKESLFQKSNNCNKAGEAIQAINNNDVLVYLSFLKKNKLNTANKMISNEQGFLKIIAVAIKHKKT